jgi:hypothetical protein
VLLEARPAAPDGIPISACNITFSQSKNNGYFPFIIMGVYPTAPFTPSLKPNRPLGLALPRGRFRVRRMYYYYTIPPETIMKGK